MDLTELFLMYNSPMAKSLFKSWTFWFGAIQIALGGVGLVSGLMNQEAAFALIATGFGSIGLRMKTTQPVSLGDSSQP